MRRPVIPQLFRALLLGWLALLPGCGDSKAIDSGAEEQKQPTEIDRIEVSLVGGDPVRDVLANSEPLLAGLRGLNWIEPPKQRPRGAPEWLIKVFKADAEPDTINVFARAVFVRSSDGKVAIDPQGFWVKFEETLVQDEKWRSILGPR